MQTALFTFVDAVEHILDWGGTQSTDEMTFRKAKRAVMNAYREVSNLKLWTYYYETARFDNVAMQNTSTITYTNTGGAYERVVTLASGTWPAWAMYGRLRIGTNEYKIATRESDTELTLSINSNPGADLAAGTSYILFRDAYPLPVDFGAGGVFRNTDRSIYPYYMTPNDFMSFKYVRQNPAQPRFYTIMADDNYVGTMSLVLYPPPDQVYSWEYIYRRQPRSLLIYKASSGTINSSGTTVTGSASPFTTDMIGSVIRYGTSTTAPTGLTGTSPYVEQRIITQFIDAGTVKVDQEFSTTLSGVKYEVSDPIDIEANAMYTFFLRRCELEMGMMMNRDDINRLQKQHEAAKLLALEADSRSFELKPSGNRVRSRVPLTWTVTNVTG